MSLWPQMMCYPIQTWCIHSRAFEKRHTTNKIEFHQKSKTGSDVKLTIYGVKSCPNLVYAFCLPLGHVKLNTKSLSIKMGNRKWRHHDRKWCDITSKHHRAITKSNFIQIFNRKWRHFDYKWRDITSKHVLKLVGHVKPYKKSNFIHIGNRKWRHNDRKWCDITSKHHSIHPRAITTSNFIQIFNRKWRHFDYQWRHNDRKWCHITSKHPSNHNIAITKSNIQTWCMGFWV